MTSSWRSRALCREVDPDVMFPDRGDITAAQLALRVCALCEVRDSCLTEALAEDLWFGIRGGLSPGRRRQLAAEMRREGAA